jgi:hypothetical protein
MNIINTVVPYFKALNTTCNAHERISNLHKIFDLSYGKTKA